MYDNYRVQFEGRTWFGNVRLREFHLFEYDGHTCLFDVNSLAAREISPHEAALINHVAVSWGGLIPEKAMMRLRALDLIAEEAQPASETSSAARSGDADKQSSYPINSMSLLLVQKCNMQCVYCYGDAGEFGDRGVMSRDTAFAAVDWLMENSGEMEQVTISFIGGEPLLNFPLLTEVVSYAREAAEKWGKRVYFGITTNGTLLTDEIIAFFQKEKIVPAISFDGPREYHDRQRPFRNGKGSYDVVRRNLDKLRAAIPIVFVNGVMHDDADPFRMEEGMEEAGLWNYSLNRASPVVLSADHRVGDASQTSKEAKEAALQRMLAFHQRRIDLFFEAIRGRTITVERRPMLLGLMKIIANREKRFYGCGVGKEMAAISVGGGVFPCHRFVGQDEVAQGSVTEKRFSGPNSFHRAPVDHLPTCSQCWARYVCGGGCFYNHKAQTGDLHRPDPFECREKMALYQGLIHIWCRLDEDDKKYLEQFLVEQNIESLF